MPQEKRYNPNIIENEWQKKWEEDEIYKMPELKKGDKKFYSLFSFPYPSGDGLHVGHAEGMVANDIAARFHRMKGDKTVLPMGWDSFGLPAENYAIKTGIHPHKNTEHAIKTFIKQIKGLGISVDWDTEVGAHRPDYYKWTQWIFLQLYKSGLAYKKKAPVNWCPSCETALANEQVIDGKCERCDTKVEQKMMKQWFYKITAYAERLAKDLDEVDWPESTKVQQRNWIGRSEGANVKFAVIASPDNIGTKQPRQKAKEVLTVFTTRPDTLFGCTYMVVCPEHDLIHNPEYSGQFTIHNKEEVMKYVKKARDKTDLQRTDLNKEKTGVELKGLKAINPVNNEEVPIYVADYVLSTYGTGAIMAVPAHDERDFEFAKKYNIEIKEVIRGGNIKKEAYTEEGENINSDFLDGLKTSEAKKKMIEWLEKKKVGKGCTSFKLRDWLVSRQRYWGCPIPIVYDPEGKAYLVEEKDLPVLLPEDVDFKPTGESPLVNSKEFHDSAKKKYGKGWKREVDTMDTFVDSSWYYFRHIDAHNDKEFVSKEKADKWLPTDLYMIGAEHIVLHLLYSRFFTKFFQDKDYISFGEPFYKMRHMGTILGPDGRKMSKRWGNVINPMDEVKKYGADTVRMYEMFMGPLVEPKAWSAESEEGVYRFLKRIWNLHFKVENGSSLHKGGQEGLNIEEQESWINRIIKKVEDGMQAVNFNTTIAKFMEFANFLVHEEKINQSVWERFLMAVAPFAPHITEELWHELGHKDSIHIQKWPKFDPKKIKEKEYDLVVQVNGKLRERIKVSEELTEAKAKELVMNSEKVKKFIGDKKIKKFIFVKGKLVNIVI